MQILELIKKMLFQIVAGWRSTCVRTLTTQGIDYAGSACARLQRTQQLAAISLAISAQRAVAWAAEDDIIPGPVMRSLHTVQQMVNCSGAVAEVLSFVYCSAILTMPCTPNAVMLLVSTEE